MPRASIVIPAHDEGAIIDRCLSQLGLHAKGTELEVVVVANACSDDTAARAREHGVKVVETATAGKANALNLGDEHATAFPRVYLDADVEIGRADLLRLVEHLSAPGVLAAAPRLTWDPTGVSWLVRAYYRVWTALPYVTQGMLGSGIYAVSEQGRARFDRFPELVGDDAFVRAVFAPEERHTVTDASFRIHPPRTLASLVAVKTRVWAGNEQHDAAGLPSRSAGAETGLSSAKVLLRRPDLWPAVPVYAGVYALARVRGRRRLAAGTASKWDRDTTSRASA